METTTNPDNGTNTASAGEAEHAPREGTIETNGVTLWFQEQGDPDGTPLVLLMGVDGSALWWPPELVDALVAAGHRVVLYDNRDVGLSSYVDTPYGLADMATDALGLLDRLGIAGAHLVGVSLGGMIAQAVALRHPERVRSLTLLTSTPGPDDRLAPTDVSVFEGLDRPVETHDDQVALTVDFARALARGGPGFDEPYYRDLVERDIARGTNPASGHQAVVPGAPSRLEALAELDVPALVVHGSEDPIFPLDHGQALADVLPRSELVVWDGVGHELPRPLMPELADRITAHVAAVDAAM